MDAPDAEEETERDETQARENEALEDNKRMNLHLREEVWVDTASLSCYWNTIGPGIHNNISLSTDASVRFADRICMSEWGDGTAAAVIEDTESDAIDDRTIGCCSAALYKKQWEV